MDFAQHFVPLPLHGRLGQPERADAGHGNDAPPGYYMLFIVNSNGVPSVASIVNVGAGSGSSPGSAQVLKASAVSSSAVRVSWTAPSGGSTPVTGYTVTPYDGSTALPSTKVTGNPAATSTTIGGLKPGTSYTFKVKATNVHGTGRASVKSNAVSPSAPARPTFVQRTSGYADTTTRLGLDLGAVTQGDRLVVQTSTWGNGASAAGVTDSIGDHFTELFSGRAADGTEMSVWTAPVTARTGSHPVITVSPSWKADVGAVALEYAGVSSAPGVESVDQIVGRGGVTRARGLVSSGQTGTTTSGNELALGLYADSGFGDTVRHGDGYRTRFGLSRTRTMMEQFVEDRVVGPGQRVSSTVHTGAKTPWLMATIVFRGAGAKIPPAKTTPPSAIAKSRAKRLTEQLRAFAAAHDAAAKHPVVPLSKRPRTHAVAGAMETFVGPTGDSQALYYCLVSVVDQ